MAWVLLLLLVTAVAVIAALVLGGRRRHRRWTMSVPQRRCLRCRGTGWIGQEPERTLTFVGDGFEDRQAPATVCPDCNGTGRR